MSESTAQQRVNWRAYECAEDKMTRMAFGPDHVLIAPPAVDAFTALATVLQADGYEIRTPDTDSYNCRAIKGGSGKSLHSYGIALDVNWDSNPYKTTPDERKVRFSDKAAQKDRQEDVRLGKADTDFTPQIIADVLAIRTQNGKRVFEWGGNWNTVKDTMHFEIDVTPDDLATGIDQSTVKRDGTQPPPPVEPPVSDTHLLEVGSRGEEVKAVQRELMVDGIYGPLTKQAVTAFQKARGLHVDGIVGPETWRELFEPPAVDDAPWQTAIKATTFGGSAETQYSAYDNHRITDTELGAGLPWTFVGALPELEVRNRDTGKSVVVKVVDKGPWNTTDNYWSKGARPQAETGTDLRGRPTNGAGIDLTPGAIRALGYDWNKNWSALVDWRFKPDPAIIARQLEANTPPQPRIDPMPPVATVPVKSAWASKINWVQVGGAVISLLTAFAAGLPPETAVLATAGINLLQGLITVLLKTFATNTVTPSSIK